MFLLAGKLKATSSKDGQQPGKVQQQLQGAQEELSAVKAQIESLKESQQAKLKRG